MHKAITLHTAKPTLHALVALAIKKAEGGTYAG